MANRKRYRGPKITDEVKLLIAHLHKEHPKYTNEEIRNLVEANLRKANPDLPEGWPSKFVIDRIMPGIRERTRLSELNPDPRDRPWTTSSMIKYPIPPEALPSVLQAWFRLRKKGFEFLTIRQAQWVARLYTTSDNIGVVIVLAMIESAFERDAERAGLDYLGSQRMNFETYHTLTGRTFTDEEKYRLTGLSDETWNVLEGFGFDGLKRYRLEKAGKPPSLVLKEIDPQSKGGKK